MIRRAALPIVLALVIDTPVSVTPLIASARTAVQSKPSENPAVEEVRKAAELGEVDAQYNLAVMYDTGRGVSQDFGRAAAWYRRAAERGHAGAQYNLALMYSTGQGVPRNEKESAAWYLRSAAAGYAPAQFNLGALYESGRGVARDDAAAVSWYGKAAEQRHAAAMYNLGAMYFRGQGVPQDKIEACKWRHLAVVYAPPEKVQQYRDSEDAMARQLTPHEIADAQARAADWARQHDMR